MKSERHPEELTDEAEAIVAAFDDHPEEDYEVVIGNGISDLRATAAEGDDGE